MNFLNIMCPICNEFYLSSDIVYSTPCGHLFHHQCICRWLSRSDTCPHCRQSCHKRWVHRVFLNYFEPTSIDEEILVTLSAKAISWVPLDDLSQPGEPSDVPAGAIKAGVDSDGNDAYVARVYLHADLLPANYVPQKGGVYAPWNCQAHFLHNEVELLLDCEHRWVADSNGHVPDDAIVTGYTEFGENLYTGRAQYEGSTLPGKIHPSHRVIYMPYNGLEVNAKEYEVLVRIPKST